MMEICDIFGRAAFSILAPLCVGEDDDDAADTVWESGFLCGGHQCTSAIRGRQSLFGVYFRCHAFPIVWSPYAYHGVLVCLRRMFPALRNQISHRTDLLAVTVKLERNLIYTGLSWSCNGWANPFYRLISKTNRRRPPCGESCVEIVLQVKLGLLKRSASPPFLIGPLFPANCVRCLQNIALNTLTSTTRILNDLRTSAMSQLIRSYLKRTLVLTPST